MIATIFSIIGSFQLFNQPNILQGIVPNLISTFYTPNMFAFNLSFTGQQFNYAATVAIIMGVLTATVAYVVQLRGGQRINEVLVAATENVGPDWQYLPWQSYANSVYPDTVGQAYVAGTDVAAGLLEWEQVNETYGQEQGYTITE